MAAILGIILVSVEEEKKKESIGCSAFVAISLLMMPKNVKENWYFEVTPYLSNCTALWEVNFFYTVPK